MDHYDIVVIGGGSAGLVVAAGAAHLGARVALVEKKALGGDCLYTGCVPSKTLIRSARFADEVSRAEEFGFAPLKWQFSGRSFAAITDRIHRVIEKVGEHDAPEQFRKLGIEVIFGTPRFLSPDKLEVAARTEEFANEARASGSGRIIRARRFCISTGSRPALPPVEGIEGAGFITNEEVFRLKRLPRSLLVLGGGPLGLELGQSFARFGSRVTIVEMGARLLPKEDAEVSIEIERILRGEGLEVLLETRVISASAFPDHKRLTVEHEGVRRELEAEEILAATGREPSTGELNLEAAGVKYDAHRILTDKYLRTSNPRIYAAGDVTGHFPFTHMAAYEASVVVRNALFFWPLTQRVDFRVVPWTTFTDPEVARVGLTEEEARAAYGSDRIKIYRAVFADNDRAHTEEEQRGGFAKLVCAGRKGRLVGAHIVGPHAGELVHEVVLAMKRRLSASSLGSLIHVYPTLTQINQRAGLDALLAKLSTPLVRKALKGYFSWWR